MPSLVLWERSHGESNVEEYLGSKIYKSTNRPEGPHSKEGATTSKAPENGAGPSREAKGDRKGTDEIPIQPPRRPATSLLYPRRWEELRIYRRLGYEKGHHVIQGHQPVLRIPPGHGVHDN